MNSAHVCLSCRRRLAFLRPASLQWQPKATFISIRGKPAPIQEPVPQELPASVPPTTPTPLEGWQKAADIGAIEEDGERPTKPARRKATSDLSKWDALEAFWKRSVDAENDPSLSSQGGDSEQAESDLQPKHERNGTTRSKITEPRPRSDQTKSHRDDFFNSNSSRSVLLSAKRADPESGTSDERKIDLATTKRAPEFEKRRREHRYGKIMPKARTSQPTSTARDELEAMFLANVNPAPADVIEPGTSALQPFIHAEALQKMLQEGYPLGDCWKYFDEHFGPDMKPHSTRPRSLPTYIQRTSNDLHNKIILAKISNPNSPFFPTMTEMCLKYLQLGTLNGIEWTRMVLTLLRSILQLRKESPKELATENILMNDLLGSWNAVVRDSGSFASKLSVDFESLDWSLRTMRSPLSSLAAQQVFNRRGFHALLGGLTEFTPATLGDMPLVTLATYSLLSESSLNAKPEVVNAQPFIALLGCYIGVHGLNFEKDIQSAPAWAQSTQDDVKAFVQETWEELQKRAISEKSRNYGPKSSVAMHDRMGSIPMAVLSPGAQIIRTKKHIENRLSHAFKQQNLMQVEEIWSEVSVWPVFTMARGHAQDKLTMEICNTFIRIFMALRQPDRSVDVWNHAVENGLVPSVKTWDEMLKGCTMAGDLDNLEKLWVKMIQSGTTPDEVIWTTRINAFVKNGLIDGAMRVLDDMGRTWLEAAIKEHPNMNIDDVKLLKEVEGVVKPHIVPITSIIHGLVSTTPAMKRRKTEASKRGGSQKVGKILAWAAQFGIKPDTATYNVRLQPLLEEGNSEEAMKLIREMHDNGIKADVVTFTTLIEELLGGTAERTPEENKTVVEATLTEMETAGVSPDEHTYSKMVHYLLRSIRGVIPTKENLKLAESLIERMIKNGLQPTAHIYNILLDYYFRQDPPNMDAVRSVIERASAVVDISDPGKKFSADRTFWDRAVECYARLGETGSALRIVGNLAKVNARVGWYSLKCLLEALAADQDWEMARSLVKDAVMDRDERLLDYSVMTPNHAAFFQLAASLNLLDDN